MELRVIGELVGSPGHFVLMSKKGQFFEYDRQAGRIRPMKPHERWQVEVVENAGMIIDVEFDDDTRAPHQ